MLALGEGLCGLALPSHCTRQLLIAVCLLACWIMKTSKQADPEQTRGETDTWIVLWMIPVH